MILSDEQADGIKEVLNIGAGNAARALNEILQSYVSINISAVRAITPEELIAQYPNYNTQGHCALCMRFCGVFDGMSAMLFTNDAVEKLIKTTSGVTPDDPAYDEFIEGTIFEVGNIVLNSMLGSIANIFHGQFEYELPEVSHASLIDLLLQHNNKEHKIIFAHTQLAVKGLDIDNEMMICFDLESFDKLLNEISQTSQCH